MPFVKKNHSQTARFSSAKVSSLFIGRTGELLFFVNNILKPEAPTHNILSISGQGGVGKSTLLGRFITEAHEARFKDYCQTAIVDERQATPISIMEKLAQQLHFTGNFEKVLKQYNEALQRRQVEREMLRDRFFQSVPDVAGAAVEWIPVAGPFLREGAKVAAWYLMNEHQESQVQQDRELLETPIDDLTREFVTELNRLADTNVTLGSTGQKRQRRIVLFFDTFEQMASEATPWLLDHFLAAQVSSNVVLVVAGRDPIEHTSPDDPKRWLPYCDEGTIYWISLNSFTEDETRMYLVEREITDADQIANIWHLSRGLPLYLGLLTSNHHGDIDPTKDVVVNFLRWIPEQEHIKRQLALDAALFTRPFNQDDLEVFNYVPESDRTSIYQWLTKQPFVRSRARDGRYLYHDVAQDLFGRHLYQLSQKHYDEIRRVLAAYYQGLFEKIQTEQGKEAHRSEEWLELLLAAISQLLLLPDQASHIKAIERFLYAYQHTNREQEREIGRALRDLPQEPSSHHISPDGRSVAMQLSHYVEADAEVNQLKSQEWLAATDALLKTVINIPSFSSELLADIYYMRGRAYRVLGKKELAFENFQQALKLLDPTNYAQQGWVHWYSQNYQEALAFQNRALERNPRDANAYIGRGWAYYSLQEYQLAIDDFDHAREMDPNENPGGRENGLRWAYYSSGKYQQALSVNNYFLERDSSDYKPYLFRSRCFCSLKDYPQSIDACNHALELAPKQADVYVKIGWAYFDSGNYQEALVVHNQALEQNPQDIDAYLGRGWAYNYSGEYQQAIDNFEYILKQDPNYHNSKSFFHGLRYAYYSAGKYQQALAANDHLLEKDPKNYEPYIFQMKCFCSLKDYPQSIDACNHALELAPKQADVYVKIGWAYFDSGNYQEALAYHNQALEHNPQDIDAYLGRGWAYNNSGEYQQAIDDFEYVLKQDPNYRNPDGLYNGLRWAYYSAGKYQQALAANDYFLEKDPKNYEPYIFRVQCFRSLKDYPQSINACNHALELAPKQAEAYFQRGLTYLWMKDLGQAQADFARSCELKPTRIDNALLAEWAGMCQGTADLLVAERLEAIATVDPEDYSTHICQGIALLLRRNLSEALAELEQALLPTRHEKWKAHFWKGMICAFLGQEEAIAAIEKALELELPPILLAPLRWFEQERSDFYGRYVVPLLAKHV